MKNPAMNGRKYLQKNQIKYCYPHTQRNPKKQFIRYLTKEDVDYK
jgi:hypothetical protein